MGALCPTAEVEVVAHTEDAAGREEARDLLDGDEEGAEVAHGDEDRAEVAHGDEDRAEDDEVAPQPKLREKADSSESVKTAAEATDIRSRTFIRSSTVMEADEFEIGARSKVCKYGTRCTRKNPAHLKEEAHPADNDYVHICRQVGHEPEFVSVRSIFDWCDPNQYSKATRMELAKIWPRIQSMGRGIGDLTDEFWQTLDDDGNGYVNFGELAEFTTKYEVRLPLGLDSLVGTAVNAKMTCGVHDCRCQNFVVRRWKCKYGDTCYNKRKEHTSQFCHPGDREWSKATAERDDNMCRCGHKRALHAAAMTAAGAVPYPDYWTTVLDGDKDYVNIIGVDDTSKFQDLLNATYSDVTTRDRNRHCGTWMVPRSYKLVSIERNENSRLWRKYFVRKCEMLKQKGVTTEDYPVYDDVKTTEAWKQESGLDIAKEINEWFLFHGTSSSAAKNICQNDFKMRLAGSATGTMFGRGSYMAESITKADEYAKEEGGCFTVLLCRVLGGCVRYCDDRSPDGDSLTKDCMEGRYDYILGDRQKVSGTYREFIIFDSDSVYPEFIFKYERGEFFKSSTHPR